MARRAVALHREQREVPYMVFAMLILGDTLVRRGRGAEARSVGDEARRVARATRSSALVAHVDRTVAGWDQPPPR